MAQSVPQLRMVDYALEYARSGIPVFPLIPHDKKPVIPKTEGGEGFKDASLDPEIIQKWWRRWPRANIGIPTGDAFTRDDGETRPASNWCVIDIDTKHGATYDQLAVLGKVPPTKTAQTPSGGLHLVFRYPRNGVRIDIGTNVLLPGIDVRAYGGYIAAAPSVTPNGQYEWTNDLEPAPLPSWLLQKLTEKPEPLSIRKAPVVVDASSDDRDGYWLAWALARTFPGNSDDVGFGLAQQLLLDPGVRDIDGTLFAYAQQASFDPSNPFTERDVDRWLKSAQKSEMVRGGEPAKKKQRAQTARPLPAKRPKLHAVPTVEEEPADYGTNYSIGDEPPTDEPSVRPEIVAKGRQLHEVTADVLTALQAANNPPFIFQRSRQLVRVVSDENQRPVIDDMDEKALTCRMSDVADFIRMNKTGTNEDGEPIFGQVAISPPSDLVKNVLAQPRWDFPALVGVTEAPFVRPDGSVCTTPGYDSATRLIYAPAQGLRIPSVPEKPTKQQVSKALAVLDDIITDFPFDSDASRAHALALLLVSVTRPAIRGLVPLALVTAPAAGTGKSLLTSIAVTVNTGRAAAMMVAADKEEEWTKRITATLLDGPSFVIIDNIRGVLKSPSLEGVLTTSVWKDRVLGASKVIELPQRAVWLATGNNIQLGGDMPRRCYRIRLDAKTARPERREGFRHPDIKAYVAHERGAVLGALLTIARAWYADGCPSYPVTPMGTFEEWSHIVGCILAHAGVTGFLSNLDEMYEEADTERPQWAAFFTAWHDQFGTIAKTSGEVAAFITSAANDNPLRAALPDEFAPLADNLGALTKKLGYRLRELRDIRYESLGAAEVFLASAGQNRTKTALWRVNQVPVN